MVDTIIGLMVLVIFSTGAFLCLFYPQELIRWNARKNVWVLEHLYMMKLSSLRPEERERVDMALDNPQTFAGAIFLYRCCGALHIATLRRARCPYTSPKPIGMERRR